jgi:hypothetical protein
VLLALCAMSSSLLTAWGAHYRPPDPGAAAAHDFLAGQLRLTSDDIDRLDRGRIVSRTLEPTDRKDIAAVAVVRVDAPKERLIERFRRIDAFDGGALMMEAGRFGTPPAMDDLAGLTLEDEDMEALRRCRPGSCKMKMSEESIRRLADVDWASADARSQATRVLKTMILEYASRYVAEGSASLPAFVDHQPHVVPGEEFDILLRRAPELEQRVPSLFRYLHAFPSATLDPSEMYLYWSKEKFGLKPVVSVTHLTIHRQEGTPSVTVAARQVYATHYFDASLGLTMLVDVSSGSRGFYMVYLNRSRTSSLAGWFRRMARGTIEARTRDGLRRFLAVMKHRLERDGPDGPSPPLELQVR